jgi:Flp pilus assembly protein TadG
MKNDVKWSSLSWYSARFRRSRRGMNTVVLVMVLAFFVVLPLALLGFEFSRYTIMSSQLQSVTDASALAGTAAMASSPAGYTYSQLHDMAMDVAAQTFQQNSVLRTALNAGNVTINKNSGSPLGAPPAYKANLNITLVDQAGNPVATGSTDAVAMRLQSLYSDSPVFSSNILNIGNLMTATAVSDGGLPQLDLFLCFDSSGSMDDQTPITLVKRYWKPSISSVDYQIKSTGKSIYDTFKPAATGTGFNAAPPQNLDYASYPSPSNTNSFAFSESILNTANNGLRANLFTYTAGTIPSLPVATVYPAGTLVPEQGLPPGNYNPANPLDPNGNGIDPNVYATCFTDAVVMVPSTGAYDFSLPATCVEASRGNMENDAICLQSQGGLAINPSLPTRQAGYYQTYWSQVEKALDPMNAARQAAYNFFYTMNIASNAHFGLSTFATAAGISATSVWGDTINNSDANWAKGGTGTFRVPLISLDKTTSNFTEVTEGINGNATSLPLRPTGQTCISTSLHEAILQLTDSTKARPKAKKAIILFTDGVPNRPTSATVAQTLALNEADWAKSKGIPIYTIGLSQNSAIKPQEDVFLGDNKAGSGPGIAYRSGNNAMYIAVTNAADLNAAFQTIARSLVVLQ